MSWATTLKTEDVDRLVAEMLEWCETVMGEHFPCSMVNRTPTEGTLRCGTVLILAEHLIWQLSGLKLAGFDTTTDKEIFSVAVSAEPIREDGAIPALSGERDPAVKEEIGWTRYPNVGGIPLWLVPNLVDPIDSDDSVEYINVMALMMFFPCSVLEWEAYMCRAHFALVFKRIEKWRTSTQMHDYWGPGGVSKSLKTLWIMVAHLRSARDSPRPETMSDAAES